MNSFLNMQFICHYITGIKKKNVRDVYIISDREIKIIEKALANGTLMQLVMIINNDCKRS